MAEGIPESNGTRLRRPFPEPIADCPFPIRRLRPSGIQAIPEGRQTGLGNERKAPSASERSMRSPDCGVRCRKNARCLPSGENAGHRSLKASAGTAHYLYKYDPTADQERDNVQVYYLRLDYRYSRAWRLNVKYDYENDGSAGHYNELRCEAICTF